ncbi:DUF2178 domain-containing protein [Thermococcus sp. 18S1]|uniref:DUF2178 domain-containing protein n=1 Tax=Thermococcus sp. 18S1 TaxID=1638210 RepID=UPI00143C8107|nr:DUF2178 domain-containing protein [Thermococcus sp. 18S1]NJE29714.1 DUF2178 domain-containing protein [Thermococcus sp. 18S1]
MMDKVLIPIIAIATVVYGYIFYKFMKETGQMKDERGRRINQVASETTLMIVQILLLLGLIFVGIFKKFEPSKVLAFIYVVAIFGHALLRYHYARVM